LPVCAAWNVPAQFCRVQRGQGGDGKAELYDAQNVGTSQEQPLQRIGQKENPQGQYQKEKKVQKAVLIFSAGMFITNVDPNL
jgi:hypothetical protein